MSYEALQISDQQKESLRLVIDEKLGPFDFINYDNETAYKIFCRAALLGKKYGMSSQENKPPGVKGLEMAVGISRILVRDKEHEEVPVVDENNKVTAFLPRAHKFYLPARRKDEPRNPVNGHNAQLDELPAKFQRRSFRFALRMILTNLENVSYYGSLLPEEGPVAIATTSDSNNILENRTLVGQRVKPGQKASFDSAPSGAVIAGLPYEAYIVMPTSAVESLTLADRR